jgi:hypothetical protein
MTNLIFRLDNCGQNFRFGKYRYYSGKWYEYTRQTESYSSRTADLQEYCRENNLAEFATKQWYTLKTSLRKLTRTDRQVMI